jgi:hypothetical protein
MHQQAAQCHIWLRVISQAACGADLASRQDDAASRYCCGATTPCTSYGNQIPIPRQPGTLYPFRLSQLRLQLAARASSAPTFPPSMTISKNSRYSLRLYEPYIALEVPYTRRADGYDLLAAYFGGMNEGRILFAEAQPVILNFMIDGSKAMQLHVGQTKDGKILTDLPAPTMPGCRLVAAGGELCAMHRFEGYATPETTGRVVAALKAALAADGIALAEAEAQGAFRVCQYGPVYSFSGRENEVLLKVKP